MSFSPALEDAEPIRKIWADRNYIPDRWLSTIVAELGTLANHINALAADTTRRDTEQVLGYLRNDFVRVAAIAAAAADSIERNEMR